MYYYISTLFDASTFVITFVIQTILIWNSCRNRKAWTRLDYWWEHFPSWYRDGKLPFYAYAIEHLRRWPKFSRLFSRSAAFPSFSTRPRRQSLLWDTLYPLLQFSMKSSPYFSSFMASSTKSYNLTTLGCASNCSIYLCGGWGTSSDCRRWIFRHWRGLGPCRWCRESWSSRSWRIRLRPTAILGYTISCRYGLIALLASSQEYLIL